MGHHHGLSHNQRVRFCTTVSLLAPLHHRHSPALHSRAVPGWSNQQGVRGSGSSAKTPIVGFSRRWRFGHQLHGWKMDHRSRWFSYFQPPIYRDFPASHGADDTRGSRFWSRSPNRVSQCLATTSHDPQSLGSISALCQWLDAKWH